MLYKLDFSPSFGRDSLTTCHNHPILTPCQVIPPPQGRLMPRPVDLDRRADLALRALDFVRSQGMRRVTISELATALSVGRPALYWYFKNLGEVFDAVLPVIVDRQRAFLLARIDPNEHPLDVLKSLLFGVCDFYAGDPQLLQVLVQFWAMGQPDQPERVLQATRDYALEQQQLALDLLTESVLSGLVAPCDVPTLVSLCLATLDGLLVQQVRQGTDPRPALALFCSCVLAPLRR